MERKFSLPNIEDLTKQQEKIRALPSEGKYLIVGGPGTGKSVVALFRVKKLQREQKNCVCLAFNKLLVKSNAQLAKESIESKQWQSWFNEICKTALKLDKPPKKDSSFEYEWQAIFEAIEAYRQSGEPKLDFSQQYLVIDEGQDMPPEFYEALIKLGFVNFFVVADQNQRITKENSSIKELMHILDIDGTEIYDLVDNYRNTYAIARLCEHFFTDAGSEKPQLPALSYDNQKPVLYGYETDRFDKVIERIINNAKDKPNQLIGIISPNNVISDKYFESLQTRICEQGLNVSLTRHYDTKKEEVSFNQGGIVVLNAQGCKGLEFDMVFLVDINHLYIDRRQPDNTKKLLYVMTSRAKKRLVILLDKGQLTNGSQQQYWEMLRLFPNDNEILEIENV